MIISRSSNCPYCGNDHSNSCYVQYDNGDHCYSCGNGSSKSKEHFVFRPYELENAKLSTEMHIPKHTLHPQEFDAECLSWLYKYYVYDDLITQYQIAYVEATKWHDKSILFPILDVNSEVIEYQRRFFPKHFFSTSNVKQEIFCCGLHLDTDVLYLVEDYISAIRVGQFAPTLCLFGTSINENILNFIVSNFSSIKIWLDPDDPGQTAASKISNLLYKEFLTYSKFRVFSKSGDISIENIFTKEQPKELNPSKIYQTIKEIPFVT